ncbi:MAG: flagellar assembly protein FliH [Betaproteobacteria bacterium]|nr:flagellar assembly protein FliH [Betaproteobacteria bacterium]
MSSKIIPKEQLSAYQRWELGSLNESERPAAGAPEDLVSLPTAEEIERIHAQAREEGLNAGYREGLEKGRRDAQAIGRMLAEARESLAQMEEAIARDVVALGLELARHLFRGSLKIRPDAVLPVVREALNALPHASHSLRLVVRPDDAALVRTQLEAELAALGCQVVEDARLSPGGCRVEAMHCEVDATIETRWKQLVATLGLNVDWLE